MASIALPLFLFVFLFAFSEAAFAQKYVPQEIEFDAQSYPARVIEFPKQYSIGSLKMVPLKEGSGRQLEVTARGKVTVPAGYCSFFSAQRQYLDHPEIAKTLPVNAFDSVQMSATALGDSEAGQLGKALASIVRFKSVRQVVLDRSDANDADIAQLASLPDLQRLSVFSCEAKGAFLKDFTAMQSLKSLRLSQNYINSDYLQYLSKMRNLEYLFLVRCMLKDDSLRHISHCTKLVRLDIARNPDVTDQSLKYIKQLKKLQFLSVDETQITLRALLSLKGLPLHLLARSDAGYSAKDLMLIRKTFPGVVVTQKLKQHAVDQDTKTIYAPLH